MLAVGFDVESSGEGSVRAEMAGKRAPQREERGRMGGGRKVSGEMLGVVAAAAAPTAAEASQHGGEAERARWCART